MYTPNSTYRIQFHKDFTLADCRRILPYLKKLGVRTLYAAPVFEAVPGSMHGYDSLNPHRINPELGTEEELRALSAELKAAGIGWLQDIVPNHMAYDTRNPWLWDVLEKGQKSPYAPFFDIDWNHPDYAGKLMAPFLGIDTEEAVRTGDLQLDVQDGRPVFRYFDTSYPVNAAVWTAVLKQKVDSLPPAIQKLARARSGGGDWGGAFDQHRADLQALLPDLLRQSVAQPVLWSETDRRINYRRFFTVNGLICLNIQDPNVLKEHHRLIRQLTAEGVFSGLRIDHIDGLYDPTAYLQQLREMVGPEPYIVVEKILEPSESLPLDWPVQGNTGYDFLSVANNLFTWKGSEEALSFFYRQLSGDTASIHQQLRDKKAAILFEHMGGELDNLLRLLENLKIVAPKRWKETDRGILRRGLGEFLVQCPVYRYYGNAFPLQSKEVADLSDIMGRVRTHDPGLAPAMDLLESIWIVRPPKEKEDWNRRALRFYQRCMQFSGPLMAKGMEDTLMYTYQRFVGHNEVGDSPESFGITIEDFHLRMRARQQSWPLSISATATHDTKRGEDARARLNVLTDIPDAWMEAVQEWMELNAELKTDGFPDAQDEYMIYQVLLSTWPMPGEEEEHSYGERFGAYLQKALREAKRHSNWTTPNEAYETATQEFAQGLLDPARPFWNSFLRLHEQVASFGVLNSLAQTVLKCTAPGTPDVYQGCEFWDFSFVDPDNRRPVDYEARLSALEELDGEGVDPEALWQQSYDPRLKLFLLHRLLTDRAAEDDLLTEGDYVPLKVQGRYRGHVLAFARRHRLRWYVVVLPLHLARLCREQGCGPDELDWADTRVVLPVLMQKWHDRLRGRELPGSRALSIGLLLKTFPLAIYRGEAVPNERGGGILLHPTSLPSPYGIGDLGPEAFAFADFLAAGGQRYWQLLPVNPTEGGQGYSPYSALSTRAGYPLLISPDVLVRDGLLEEGAVAPLRRPSDGKVDFTGAEELKQELLQKAFERFRKETDLHADYAAFCEAEADWLEDFALYSVLKQAHGGGPWYEWPEPLRLREPEALAQQRQQQADALDFVRFQQFLFFRQWRSLKAYCNARDIRLIGDLPIYVSYDSADVWSHQEIFMLDAEGRRLGMAGVPPDAFSADGQLWGMPVYRWDVLKERNYDWWIERLRKNIELFDLVRLDHFRAFADYWEVPAGETTARNGSWQPGPGADLFVAVQRALGRLPFVAEDLGDIDDKVLELRDTFRLPGMNVLQFAFGEEMPQSAYIPHGYIANSLVYTGTHDNNTTRGWYRQEADEFMRHRVNQYLGRDVHEGNVAYELGRLAYSSVSHTVILPIQDVLGLDEGARMNLPASGEGNWGWRLPHRLSHETAQMLRHWVWLYNRE